MLLEFAVEPRAMGSSWDNFRYLFDHFGFDRGRLIARFPRRWEKKVIHAAKSADMSDVRLKSLVERLQRAGNTKFIDLKREYNPELEWLANALRQQAEKPFHAIIASENPETKDFILVADDLDEANELFMASRAWEVPRTSAGISGAVRPILCSATEFAIIDPFFDLRNPQGANYTGPLEAMLAAMKDFGKVNVRLEIHYRTHDTRPPPEFIERNARSWVNGIIPAGYSLVLYEWQERNGGEDFHDRYLLCDCGGLSIGAGFAAEGDHQNALISLLDLDAATSLKAKFTLGTEKFDLVQPRLEVASDGTVTRR